MSERSDRKLTGLVVLGLKREKSQWSLAQNLTNSLNVD